MCLLQEFSALHAHSLQTEVDITCVGCISRFATSVGTLNENVKLGKVPRPAKPKSVCLPCLVPL